MEPAGKEHGRGGPRQAPSPSAPRGAKVTPRRPASAVGIQGRSRSHLALNINVSACKRWGAGRTRAHEPLQHPLQVSVGVPPPAGPVRSPLPPWLRQDLPPAPEKGCARLRLRCTIHVSAGWVSAVAHARARAAARTRRPETAIYGFAALQPLAHFSACVGGLCGAAGTPVPQAARQGCGKGWRWLQRDWEGSWCRHQFGLSGPAVMATHIPFASGAKRRQLLPRDPRSPWRRGADRRREGRGGPAAPVRAVTSRQRPKSRAVTDGAPSRGKPAPARTRSPAPTTSLTKGPVPSARRRADPRRGGGWCRSRRRSADRGLQLAPWAPGHAGLSPVTPLPSLVRGD